MNDMADRGKKCEKRSSHSAGSQQQAVSEGSHRGCGHAVSDRGCEIAKTAGPHACFSVLSRHSEQKAQTGDVDSYRHRGVA